MIQELYTRLKWWYSGEVSETVVETFDDQWDAIFQPVLGVVLCAVLVLSGYAAIGTASVVIRAAGVTSLLFGVLVSVVVCVHLGAAYVYATEPTELPREAEAVVTENDR